MRRLTFEAGALFAGRMPMTSCFVAGGVSNDISVAGDQFPGGFVGRCQKFAEIIQTVGEWIAREYVPIAFTLGLLYVDFDNQYNTGVNSNDLALIAGKNYGGGLGRFLAWGGFPDTGATGTLFSKGGVAGVNAAPVTTFTASNKAEIYAQFLDGGSHSVQDNLTEDIAWSRYDISAADTDNYTGSVAYPGDVRRTMPARDNGYSYMKAPRWNGYPCEVGPFARQVVNGTYPQGGAPFTNLAAYVALYTVNGLGAAIDIDFLTPELKAGLGTLRSPRLATFSPGQQLAARTPGRTVDDGPVARSRSRVAAHGPEDGWHHQQEPDYSRDHLARRRLDPRARWARWHSDVGCLDRHPQLLHGVPRLGCR